MNERYGPEKEQRRERLAWETVVTWGMAAWLTVQTIAEYVVAQAMAANLPILLLINLLEAASIMYFFQHIYRLWCEEES
jgi:hypothetical protein